MTKLMIILALLFSVNTIADDVPDYMKDGVITVTLKDGKQYTFSTNTHKVVVRGSKAVRPTLVKAAEERPKNRVRLLGGYGPSGELNTTQNSSSVTVKTDSSAVGGVGYDRLLTDKLSIGGQIQTNETVLINLGFDF
jgi:hypothetical protein